MDKGSELRLKKEKKRPDFRLLLEKLEKAIERGEREEKCVEILRRQNIWTRLGPNLQLRWARMAQMAGEVDLALAVLAHINEKEPQCSEAWEERIELLAILERREELARVIKKAKDYTEQARIHENTILSAKEMGHDSSEPEDEFEPFIRLKERRDDIQLFLGLFSGRQDCFARQWAEKAEGRQGYVPVRRPMEPEDVEEHLSGRKTYGIYILRSDSKVNLAVIDADLNQGFRNRRLTSEDKNLIRRERAYLFSRIDELARQRGLYPLAEFSGSKGYHFWFFFANPCPSKVARRLVGDISAQLSKDLTTFHLEVFPKQDSISGKGLGNLVKLPLGIHRLTGKRSYFLACANRSVDAQLKFLRKVKRSNFDCISADNYRIGQAELLIHPKLKQWAEKYPELMKLETLCPPLGQIIASCRNGHQPSVREEKIIYQTIGFLPNANTLLHHLFGLLPDYNQHLVNFRLSRVRGKPLGCKRIHSLLNYSADFCPFQRAHDYPHPLLHLQQWQEGRGQNSEKVEDLRSALENLKAAIVRLEAFLK